MMSSTQCRNEIALASSWMALTIFVFTASNREALFHATPNYVQKLTAMRQCGGQKSMEVKNGTRVIYGGQVHL